MKNKLFGIFTVVMLFVLAASASVPVYAAEKPQETISHTVVYNSDGSYMVTVIQEELSLKRSSGISGSKTTSYYSAGNKLEWQYTVRGSFTYNGSSATATSVSSSYNILVSGWNITKDSTSKSGDTVTASGTFKLATLTKNVTVSLTCSKDGNLS